MHVRAAFFSVQTIILKKKSINYPFLIKLQSKSNTFLLKKLINYSKNLVKIINIALYKNFMVQLSLKLVFFQSLYTTLKISGIGIKTVLVWMEIFKIISG